jgi:hypothetical protein
MVKVREDLLLAKMILKVPTVEESYGAPVFEETLSAVEMASQEKPQGSLQRFGVHLWFLLEVI